MIYSDSYINLEFLVHGIEGWSRAWDAYENWGIWLGFAKIVTMEKEVKGNEKGTKWHRLKEDTFDQLLKHNLSTFYLSAQEILDL